MKIHIDLDDLEKQLNSQLDEQIESLTAAGWIPDEGQQCFQSACAFADTFVRCMMPVQVEDNLNRTPQLPGIVNASFACELFLKAQLIFENKKNKSIHDLLALFKLTNTDFQKLVFEHYSYLTGRDQPNFESDMSSFRKTFVEWRYAYEKKGRITIRLLLLTCFLQSLLHACLANGAGWALEEKWMGELTRMPEELVLVSAHEGGYGRRFVLKRNQ